MTSSVSLSTKMSNILFDTACLMMRFDSRRKRFKDGAFEGIVTTSFHGQSLCGVSGTEFFAEVETELGKGKVKFLVREADARIRNKLEWTPFFSVEDMMEELNTPPSRQMPIYN